VRLFEFFLFGWMERKEQGLEVVVIDSCYPIVPFSSFCLVWGCGMAVCMID
jgi:hypothetical protein